MSDPGTAADLSALNDRLSTLLYSTRRTLPVFLLGVLATVIAAAVAIYYILTLSSDLDDARDALRQSQAALLTARTQLETTKLTLLQVQASSRNTGPQLASAIADLSRSQSDLTAVSASIKQAASKLPDAPDTRPAAASTPQQWFAVAGSYSIDAGGMEKANAQMHRITAAGLCAELWQTQISRNYAVVVGTRSDRAAARAAAGRARSLGLASDAFAQPDRGWTKLPQSPGC